MSPSYHHAYITVNLSAIFHDLKKYSVFSDLTLQIGEKDYISDICLYPKRKISYIAGDIIRMTEMPLLAVEILSPSQGTQEIIDKFGVYFGADIKSCWLVVPILRSVIRFFQIPNRHASVRHFVQNGNYLFFNSSADFFDNPVY